MRVEPLLRCCCSELLRLSSPVLPVCWCCTSSYSGNLSCWLPPHSAFIVCLSFHDSLPCVRHCVAHLILWTQVLHRASQCLIAARKSYVPLVLANLLVSVMITLVQLHHVPIPWLKLPLQAPAEVQSVTTPVRMSRWLTHDYWLGTPGQKEVYGVQSSTLSQKQCN